MRKILVLFIVIVSFCVGLSPSTLGQSRRERREQQVEESEKPRKVSGGESFQVNMPYDKTYDAVLNFLKKQDYRIEEASKETGQITTAIEVSGTWRQTGKRVLVTFIKESDAATTVKVAVTKQKRWKAAQTEPWGDPKVDGKESAQLVEQIKTAHGAP